MPELVPIRYGRMLRSPFTFLRGSAGLMAYDLATTTPNTGLRVQACGDCHLLNFGMFATPERNLVFDMNDFDETLPAPWEWDVKRLARKLCRGRPGQSLLRRGGPRRRHRVRARLPGALARVFEEEPAGRLVRASGHAETLIEQAPDAKAKKAPGGNGRRRPASASANISFPS